MKTFNNINQNQPEDNNVTTFATSNFDIRWNGSADASNSAAIQHSNFNSKKPLYVAVTVTGTPILGDACTITVTPTNCKLLSGLPNAFKEIDAGNMNLVLPIVVTPTSAYNGKTVKFTVSIKAARGEVLQARGNIGESPF